MQPAPQKHQPEVVYRRTPELGTASGERGRGYAPAIAPLVTGFLLLLAVLVALGVRSANKMNDVGSNARMLTLAYSSHLNTLLDIRLAAINLNNEARLRDARSARGELSPPLELRLDNARDDLKAVYHTLGPTPMDVNSKDWDKLKADLNAYIEVTEDQRQYSLKGFDK